MTRFYELYEDIASLNEVEKGTFKFYKDKLLVIVESFNLGADIISGISVDDDIDGYMGDIEILKRLMICIKRKRIG